MDQLVGKPPDGKRSSSSLPWGTIALILPMLIILAAAGWLVARTWISAAASPMPAMAYVAMAFGVLFSLLIGCGLMALLFYSHRHGYDDISYDQRHRPDDSRP